MKPQTQLDPETHRTFAALTVLNMLRHQGASFDVLVMTASILKFEPVERFERVLLVVELVGDGTFEWSVLDLDEGRQGDELAPHIAERLDYVQRECCSTSLREFFDLAMESCAAEHERQQSFSTTTLETVH